MTTEKAYEDCECGYRIHGNSKIHAIANLKLHKNSKLHKKLMEVKKK